MRKIIFYVLIITISTFFVLNCAAPVQHKAKYETKKWRDREYEILTLNFAEIDLEAPKTVSEFNPVVHCDPLGQYRTATCWCFATTSFLESEIYRLTGKKVKLSEMFTVYWEYIERAKYFVERKGDMYFAPGSQPNAVLRSWKNHGIVREEDYNGLLSGETEHNHSKMHKELKELINYAKENEIWDEEWLVMNFKTIMNKHMGKPPEKIEVDGTLVTPKEYLNNVLKIDPSDYVVLMSFKYLPFYTKGEYKVPDNWWHCKDFYNVPLKEFYSAIKNAIQKGYSVGIAGDVSEPGINYDQALAFIPSFDISYKNINQDSRELRFYNRTSTDDHAVHLIGYKEKGGHDWFLIKDSSGGFRGKLKGYYFMRDDYIKLKILIAAVHKDAVKDLLKNFR